MEKQEIINKIFNALQKQKFADWYHQGNYDAFICGEHDAPSEEEIKKIKLSDYKGRWVVLIFYPADFTFVCPTELADLADKYAELQSMGVEVFSVSTDTHFTHKAWHDASDTIKKIAYPMVGDPTHAISRNFGVLIEEEGLALRGTFVVNPEGEIKVVGSTTFEDFKQIEKDRACVNVDFSLH